MATKTKTKTKKTVKKASIAKKVDDKNIRRISDISPVHMTAAIDDLRVLVGKHGKNTMRIVARKFFERIKNEEKLRSEIARKEKELHALKKELP